MRSPSNLYRLVRNFLSERSVFYRTSFSSLERQHDKDCSQGSNSGPFFWNLVANSLLDLDLREFVRIIACADDFAVIVEAHNTYVCSRRANVALERVAKWEELHKLTFSSEKTISIYFRKMRKMGRRRNPNSVIIRQHQLASKALTLC